MARRDLTTGSIAGHFRALAIPTAIGLVFTTLYNVVDVYYAGMLTTDAQAGLAISFQVFFVLIAVGFGLSTAMSALVGNALGEGSGDETLTSCQGLVFAAVVSGLGIVLGWFAAPPLIALISEPGAYRDAANAYLGVLIFAAPAFLIAYGANGILTAQGDTKSMLYANIGAFFANVALNPLFIFGLGPWDGIGFNGIALSTLVSQSGVAAFILWRVFASEVMQGKRHFAPDLAMMGQIAGQAFPASFAMMVMMIAGFVVQYFLKSFGGAAVAAYGIALRIEQLLLLPAFGLTGALLPIASQNMGARNFDRVREAAMFCFKSGIVLMLGASCVLWFAAGPALSVFTDDADVIEIGKSYLHVDGFILPVYVMLFAINSLLQAFRRPGVTLWIGIYRQGVGVALFGWIFVRLFDMGYFGVWLGIATAVTTGLALALVLTERVARQKIGGLFRRAQVRAC
ncbi:MATE family efflux transporter [Oceaniovalibus sp. ACAM 378]|uniref:MATE family efflux transporter n=1 Tax=Oceaniovalibus sp. ACAM 378 TaxID=2599923 RepID=UPI0011D40FB9|nr:MATE family efflux transporter [Oceaniovalibus sp. ACAM 378]TYB91106.1 MATE family efflux transporter [Oceaniovalibus sp. ACAM 378]